MIFFMHKWHRKKWRVCCRSDDAKVLRSCSADYELMYGHARAHIQRHKEAAHAATDRHTDMPALHTQSGKRRHTLQQTGTRTCSRLICRHTEATTYAFLFTF